MVEQALFALGCFWEPDDFFSKLPGVAKVTVGYTGGTTPDPTYEKLGDHTESVLIEFDPEKVTYQELLQHFWSQHDAGKPQKTQYRSAIWYFDESQHQAAEESLAKQGRVSTTVEPAGRFYDAEEYHQKYLEKFRAFRGQ